MRVPGPFMSVTAANLPWGGSGTSNGTLGRSGRIGCRVAVAVHEPAPGAAADGPPPGDRAGLEVLHDDRPRPSLAPDEGRTQDDRGDQPLPQRPRSCDAGPLAWRRDVDSDSRASRSPSFHRPLCSSSRPMATTPTGDGPLADLGHRRGARSVPVGRRRGGLRLQAWLFGAVGPTQPDQAMLAKVGMAVQLQRVRKLRRWLRHAQ